MDKILWYKNSFGEEEAQKIKESISNKDISQGPVSKDLERKIAESLDIPYVLTTANGSIALLMSMLALDISYKDEVIVPNRTWIATANAPLIVGAKVNLVDVLQDIPLLDTSQIRKKITSKTKAIIPVHLNGSSVNMNEIKKIAKEYNLFVIEDACQAMFSKNSEGYLGAQSDIGCFSLDKNKIISTGLGGIIVTKNPELYEKLKLIRHHGLIHHHGPTMTPAAYGIIGNNFRLSDILSSIGIVQLSKIKEKIDHVKNIYNKYNKALDSLSYLKIIPVDISKGELPLYTQALCKERSKLINHLNSYNIHVRPFDLSLDSAPYLKKNNEEKFPNSEIFSEQGLYLPCGPAQPLENIDRVIKVLRLFNKNIK